MEENMAQKQLNIFATSLIVEDLGNILLKLIPIVLRVFKENKMDMYIVEKEGKNSTVRACGYKDFTGKLDEETILARCDFAIKRNFWFKVDDYGDSYVGTCLYPEEY
jgi:hypothetical protein